MARLEVYLNQAKCLLDELMLASIADLDPDRQ
jgi:hypothetical protein